MQLKNTKNDMEKALKAGEDVDLVLLAEVTDQITQMEAACDLHAPKIAALPFAAIKVKVSTLASEGHEMPPSHEFEISKVSSGETHKRGDAQAWARCMSLRFPRGNWSIDSCNFSDCKALHMDATSEDFKAFQVSWVASVFDSTFWKFYNGVDNAVERKHFCADLKAFMADPILGPAELPETMVELHFAVLKVFRGLFGLLDARPGVASLADVRYIMPDNATTAGVIQDIPKFGRALVSATRKDRCSVFVKALDEFQSTIGMAQSIAEDHKRLVQQTEDLFADLEGQQNFNRGFGSAATWLEEVYQKATEWKPSLREGALTGLLDGALALVRRMVAVLSNKGCHPDVPGILEFHKGLRDVLTLCQDAQLLQQVSDTILQLECTHASANIDDLIKTITAECSLPSIKQLAIILGAKPELEVSTRERLMPVFDNVI